MHVEFAIRDRGLIRVDDQEADHLPPSDRRRIRRTQRSYADVWARALRADALAQLLTATARAALDQAATTTPASRSAPTSSSE